MLNLDKSIDYYFALAEECRDVNGFILENDFVRKFGKCGLETVGSLIVIGIVKRFTMDLVTCSSFGYDRFLKEVDGVVVFRKGGIRNRRFLSFSPFNELKIGGCYELV